MVDVTVADDDSPDVGHTDGLAELAVDGLYARKNLPRDVPRPLPVSNSVGRPAPSSRYTRAESVSNTWQGIRYIRTPVFETYFLIGGNAGI